MGVTPDLACALDHARRQTFELVAPLTQAQLEATPDPIMSPLDWDLGHIAAHEDLWLVHRHGGEDLLRGDLAALYDAFETPRTVRGDLPILRGRAVREYPAYSEVFFGDRHRVLRGGSWATGERLRSPTLRNWDLPARRQIFAGLRLAKDAP